MVKNIFEVKWPRLDKTMPDKLKDKKRARGSSSNDAEEEDRILKKLSSIQMRRENGFTVRMQN